MKTKFFIAFTIIALFGITACNTVPEIPDDMTAAQLLQAGQDAMSSSRYNAADSYFTEAINRYGSNASVYIEARYEQGCVYLKQKKYDKAQTVFEEILDLYDEMPYGVLPPAFQKLAQIRLEQIPENKLNKNKE